MNQLNTEKLMVLRMSWASVVSKIDDQVADQVKYESIKEWRGATYTMGKAILDYINAVRKDVETKHPIPSMELIGIDDNEELQTHIIMEQMYVRADDASDEWCTALDETLSFLFPDMHVSIESNK